MTKANKRTRLVLIDADTIIFAAALGADVRMPGAGLSGEDVWLQSKSVDQCYEEVVERFDEIVTATGADAAIICLSDRDNFRYSILPSYKQNRHGSRRPPLLAAVNETLQERKPFPVIRVEGLEADDVCGITAGTLRSATRETVIASPDKDLKTIPGLYYSCRPDAVVEVITEDDADRNHLYQTLVGDPTDCYVGCPKIGPIKAAAILDEVMALPKEARWNKIVEVFVSKGLTADFGLTQARVARILRSTDWDASKREVILWSPA